MTMIVGAFYLPIFASYAAVAPENQSTRLALAEFLNWLLTQFGSVDELRKAIQPGTVAITATVEPGWGGNPAAVP